MADTVYRNGRPMEPEDSAELHVYNGNLGGTTYVGAYLEVTGKTGKVSRRVYLDRWEVRRLAAMAAAAEAAFAAQDAEYTRSRDYRYETIDELRPYAEARVKAGLTGRPAGTVGQPYDAPAWPAPRDPWVGTPGYPYDEEGKPVPGSQDPYRDPSSPHYRPPDYRAPATSAFWPTAEQIAKEAASIEADYGHAPMTRDLPPGNEYRRTLERFGAWPPTY